MLGFTLLREINPDSPDLADQSGFLKEVRACERLFSRDIPLFAFVMVAGGRECPVGLASCD